jgi:amino acid transporter
LRRRCWTGAAEFILRVAVAYALNQSDLVGIAYVALLLVGTTVINLRGVRATAATETLVIAAMVGLILVLGVLTLGHRTGGSPSEPANGSFLQAVATAPTVINTFNARIRNPVPVLLCDSARTS